MEYCPSWILSNFFLFEAESAGLDGEESDMCAVHTHTHTYTFRSIFSFDILVYTYIA